MAAHAAQGWRCGGTTDPATRIAWMVGPTQTSCVDSGLTSATAEISTNCTGACQSGIQGGCVRENAKCNLGYAPNCSTIKCVALECTPNNTQNCTMTGATTATKTCNSNGTWGTCVAASCQTGYALNSGVCEIMYCQSNGQISNGCSCPAGTSNQSDWCCQTGWSFKSDGCYEFIGILEEI